MPLSVAEKERINKGVDAFKRGDHETALQILEPLAEQEIVVAQFYCGVIYAYKHNLIESNQEDCISGDKWLIIAERNGSKLAGEWRDNFERQMHSLSIKMAWARVIARDLIKERSCRS